MASRNRHISERGGTDADRRVDPAWNPTRPKSIDEIIAERSTPPLTVRQLVDKWAGVFEPEFWEDVRRGARSR
jgi:hypothetical protein